MRDVCIQQRGIKCIESSTNNVTHLVSSPLVSLVIAPIACFAFLGQVIEFITRPNLAETPSAKGSVWNASAVYKRCVSVFVIEMFGSSVCSLVKEYGAIEKDVCAYHWYPERIPSIESPNRAKIWLHHENRAGHEY